MTGLLSAAYIVVSATIISYYDSLWGPPDTAISLYNSIYFMFMSLGTIGLGDIMPENAPVSCPLHEFWDETIFHSNLRFNKTPHYNLEEVEIHSSLELQILK